MSRLTRNLGVVLAVAAMTVAGCNSSPTDKGVPVDGTGGGSDADTGGFSDASDSGPADAKQEEDTVDPWADSDEDGVIDRVDNCPTVKNPNQKDTDKDSIGDKCDNCKQIPNKQQKDSDGDGTGDACLSDPQADPDGDGKKTAEDNCPVDANKNQKD
ncbi:MAG: thrombospondin type 3 repeat-containing protein, partial [Bradymonadaceae bacterium]